jgi:hypothetical protein
MQATTHTEETLHFSLRITTTEKSKDSHSTTQTWLVKDNELAYTKTYSGRGQERPPLKNTQKLTTEQIESLKELINTHLQQNIEVPKQTEFNTPYNAVRCVWELKAKDQTFRIELYELSKNIIESRIYQQLKEITQILKN